MDCHRWNSQLTNSNCQDRLPQFNWRLTINNRESALVRPSPFSLLPRLPHAERLHQFINVRLVKGLFDLRVMKPGTDPLWSIGDAKAESSCLGHMFPQLCQVHLVESIGHGV